MAFLRFVFLSMIFCAIQAFGSEEKVLPKDQPVSALVIHRLKHPLDQSNHTQLNFGYLYGDKFLDAVGVVLQHQYYFSEEWGVGGALSFYKNFVSKDVPALSVLGATPVMANPRFMGEFYAQYMPIYGKFLIGSYIQHLRMGLLAGLHAANIAYVDSSGIVATHDYGSTFAVGPLLGLQAHFPFSNMVFADVQSKLYLNRPDLFGLRQEWRTMLAWSLGVGVKW